MDEYLRWEHMENTHYLKQSHHLQEYEESCWWIILNEWKKNKGKPRKLSESEGRKFFQETNILQEKVLLYNGKKLPWYITISKRQN